MEDKKSIAVSPVTEVPAVKVEKKRPNMDSVEKPSESVVTGVTEKPAKQNPQVEKAVAPKKEKVKPIKKNKGKVVLVGKATISVQDEKGDNITLRGYHDAKLGDIIEY